MPKLITINGFGQWGDMIAFNGRIYTLDSTGGFQQLYGSDEYPEHYPGEKGTNDDGMKSTCVDLALARLGIASEKSTEALRIFREQLGDKVGVPNEIFVPFLDAAGYELMPFTGLLADFLFQHPTGKFFVVTIDYDEKHATAAIDGSVYNVKYGSIKDQVHKVWKNKT